MAHVKHTHSLLGALLLGLGGTALVGGALWWRQRKLYDEEQESSETVDDTATLPRALPSPLPAPSARLAPPLAPPLRGVTPHGQYNAPRPAGSKPGDGKFTHRHQGVDLKGKADEPILAVGNGQIVSASAGKGELVRVLLLDDGRAVVYADLGTATVQPGTRVKVGDQIGTMRKNGFVHVAVRESRYGKFIDPAGIIPFDGGK